MQPQQIDTTADELAAIARREWEAGINAVIHKALDTGRCPECDGSGIAVEYKAFTSYDGSHTEWDRREVWCECGIELKGQMICAWCRLILGESGTEGQSGGVCPTCREWLTGGTIDERT